MTSPPAEAPARSERLHPLRLLIVVELILLTAQGWTGDTVNIFLAPANGTAPPPDFVAGVASLGPILIWHAYEGIAVFFVAVALVALSFLWTYRRGVRIATILGLIMVVSAGIGGVLFLGSGFSAGGSSAQMGGSYIGSYAFPFIALYYTK